MHIQIFKQLMILQDSKKINSTNEFLIASFFNRIILTNFFVAELNFRLFKFYYYNQSVSNIEIIYIIYIKKYYVCKVIILEIYSKIKI